MNEGEKTIRHTLAKNLDQFKKKRVAVYARVSRESDLKHLSIEAQKENLKNTISKRPDWEYVDCYVDEGYTGTKLDRPEFNRMLNDAKAGKLDIILTKTVSRLGRNSSALFRVLQELKSLDVIVIFDNENFSTADPDAMFYLQYLGIQAEAEAKQTSDYMRWSVRNRFKEGIPSYFRLYGYQMIDHKLYIIPEEAEVIKMIFNMYLGGMGKGKICKELNRQQIPSFTGTEWKPSTIYDILHNEKYTGDMLLQKVYVYDFMNKRKKRNYGELPQFFVEDCHEPIIDKETFRRVQAEIARRKELYGGKNKSDKKTPRLFSQLIRCGNCNRSFVYKCNTSNKYKRELWACLDYIRIGKKYCPIKPVREDILIKTTSEVLLSQNLIKENTILTNKILKDHIRQIIVLENQELEYHLHNGENITKKWQYESRSKSWTSEMRQKARERTLKQFAKTITTSEERSN